MRARYRWFNYYFLGLLLLGLGTGCLSPEEKANRKAASTIRLYIESDYDTTGDKTTLIPIMRSNPVTIRIEKNPVLSEAYIADAALVETMGGFAIQVTFDYHGKLVLEALSSTHRGRRVAIYSMWNEGRWLAAPQLSSRLTEGTLVFTPDATRQEAERIVRGLNNIAIKIGNKSKPGKEPKSGL